MEEKKEIKIRLSTAICMIIIFALIVALGVTYYFGFVVDKKENVGDEKVTNTTENVISNVEKENDTEKEENKANEIKDNNESDEKIPEIKGQKLVQFENNFFELEDIAKEYRVIGDIKNYKDFNYDLDGDGVKDKITIRKVKNDDVIEASYEEDYYVHILELNGKEFSRNYTGGILYIVDLNENDKKLDVVELDNGPSDDPNYFIYSKKGNKMVELKNIWGHSLKSDKKGTFVIGDDYNGVTNPEIYFNYYTIKNNKIEQKETDIAKLKDLELKAPYLYFSKDFKNLSKFRRETDNYNEDGLKDFDIEKLNENITFKIIDFKEATAKEWEEGMGVRYKLYVELSDGRKGYVFHIQWAG